MEEPSVSELLSEWERRCRINLDTHAWAERQLDRINTVCAVISVGSMVVLGVVASGFDLSGGIARYVVVTLSIIAALVSVVATVRNYGLLAASHRNAARQYGALRREIEMLSAVREADRDQLASRLRDIQRRWDWIADVAPNAPRRIRERAKAQARQKSIVSRPFET